MKSIRFLPLLILIAGLARADVVPSALFSDHAVLQCDKPVPVWGVADAGEKISVRFAGHTVKTVADASGRWRVELAPQPASAESRQLVIRGRNKITLSDIVVGEVWIASGQSNMEFEMIHAFDSDLEIAASAHHPLVRDFKVAHRVAENAATDVAGAWQRTGPDTTGKFTAVGYYFAVELSQLLNVPVGIVDSSWGATSVEPWMDPAALASDSKFAVVSERWTKILADYPAAKNEYEAKLKAWHEAQAAAKSAGRIFDKRAPVAPPGPGHRNTPSGLYNGMIAPLTPLAARGFIWYQGEGNAGRASEYHALFSAMIEGWRRDFGQGDMPFYWVQLANFSAGDPAGTAWAFLREAQTQTLSLPNTGQAVIIDLGDVSDIHPRDKRDVGLRLARLALRRNHGRMFTDGGPTLSRATRDGAAWSIEWTNTSGGLKAPHNELSGFELAGDDRVFHLAQARIEGERVIVTLADVPAPVAVRYAWRNAPEAGLFNGAGLPATPFRTDAW